MSDFQIDDVRELFAEDMGRFNGELASQTAVLRSALLEVTGQLGRMEKATDAVAVAFHGVAGTSSLLHIDSTHRVAIELEQVSAQMADRLQKIIAQVTELERMCSACEHGTTGLASLIASELDKQRASATAASEGIVREVRRRTAAESPAAGDTDDEQRELQAVFQQELATAMAEISTLLTMLEQGPDPAGALSRLGAVLHMIKGAAASVGATETALELRNAYETVEDFLERGELPTSTEVRRFGRDLLALAPKLASVPPASVDDGWGEPAPIATEPDAVDPSDVFRQEARELLREHAKVEAPEALAKLFHRLKGSALVVELPEVAAIAAALEANAREGLPIDHSLLQHLEHLVSEDPSATTTSSSPPPPPVAGVTRVSVAAIDGELWQSFREESNDLVETLERQVRELAEATSLARATSSITDLLGTFHTLKGAANAVGLSPIGRELHVVETILEQLQLDTSSARRTHVVRVLIDVVARLRRNIRTAQSGHVDDGTTLLERASTALAKLAAETGNSGSWIGGSDSAWSRAPHVPNPSSGSDDASQESHNHASGKGSSEAHNERRYVRVAADRLDALMDMVGELIISRSRVDAGLNALSSLHREQEHRRKRITEIVESFTEQAEYANLGGQARRRREEGTLGFGVLEFDVYEEVHVFARRLAEAASDVGDTASNMVGGINRLSERTEELGRIVSTLQGQINRARMVPLDTLFTRLSLAVRDAAERERKHVDFVASGSEVVIDKAIADQLAGPLLHLVRNAVAHGVESAGERASLGKPERGRVRVSARQEAGEIFLEVEDDGRGLDYVALHRAGVAAGLLDPGSSPEAPEVSDLVFAPGISTSRSTTDVAGRGMGGDIVKKVIQRLGGSTAITNRPGKGVTFQVRLPVTLAITRAVVIRQANRLFAVPMLFVERIVGLDDAALAESGRKLRYGHELLPIVHVAGETAPKVFLVCAAGGKRLAVAADVVVAHEEIVVERLGYLLDGHSNIAGASQRGDGELALVLDMHGLADQVATRERRSGRERPIVQPTQPVRVPIIVPTTPMRAPVETILRVLFVDDSLSVRRVAEATLKRLGVSVVTANDGREALERLRDGEITVVFTDLEMPRMHGYELIQEMRLLPAYRTIPIVVVSSRSGDKHVRKALEAGANEYLTKPFSDERFASVLAKLVPSFRWSN